MKIFAEDAYHRFDRVSKCSLIVKFVSTQSFSWFVQFNAKYNPAGQSRLREVFLKTSNKLKGRYLAELVT